MIDIYVCILRMRLIPGSYTLDKVLTDDVQLRDGSYYLIKGTTVSVAIMGVHRNASIWKNPNTFDPDRWTEERIKEIPEEILRYAFIPFAIGQRGTV